MQYRSESRRGRPNGRYRSQADIRLLEYLAKVSMKYGIDSDRLFDSLLIASQHQKSKCENLSIECRVRERDYAVFLIARDWEVVGQFRMSRHLLNGKPDPIREFASRLSTMNISGHEAESNSYDIEDLRAGMKHVDTKARVLEISQPIQIATRSGFYANVVNALIADGTGTVRLSLLGPQIKGIALHDIIQIKNAHVAWFRGERQLRVGRHGKISVAKHAQPQDAAETTRSDENIL